MRLVVRESDGQIFNVRGKIGDRLVALRSLSTDDYITVRKDILESNYSEMTVTDTELTAVDFHSL